MRYVRAAWGVAILFGAMVGLAFLSRLYQVDAHGVSSFIGKPPTHDFTNLWYGGRLVLEGRSHILFDVQAYRAGLEQMFASSLRPSEWSYPPSILLIGAPLALLPLYPAYILWTLGTLAGLTVILRKAGLPIVACALLWIAPAALINIYIGQNGAATAALLIGGLLMVNRKPWLAGLCFGLLTLKPHLGLLVPVALVAAGHWRAIGWSAFFTVLIAGASAALFGPSVWQGFFTVTQPLMRSILEAPYGMHYQMIAATPFLMARWVGTDVPTAYAVQALVSLAAAATIWKLWRTQSDPLLRIGATAALAVLATPYAYSYDMVMLAAAILIFAIRWKPSPLLIPAWLLPVLTLWINREIGPLGPIILAPTGGLLAYIAMRSGPSVLTPFGTRRTVRQTESPTLGPHSPSAAA